MLSTDAYVGAEGAAWAFFARTPTGDEPHSGPLHGGPTHVAEWVATAEALAWAEARLAPGDALELRTDSALVAKGLAGRRPAMTGEAAELRAGCRQALARLAARGVEVRVVRVRREENAAADQLARDAATG